MNKIQRLSHILLKIFYVLAVSLPLAVIMTWLLMDWAPLKNLIERDFITCHVRTPDGLINLYSLALTGTSKVIGFIGDAVVMMPIWFGYIVCIQLFKFYQNGKIFELENIQCYRRLGWLCFINALLVRPIGEVLMILAMTFANPPGQRILQLSFGTPNVSDLFMGMLMVTISWIMAEAHQLKQDQQLTV